MLPPNVDPDTSTKRTNKSSPDAENFVSLWITAAEPSSASSVLDKSYSFVPSGFISASGSLEVFPPDSILSNMQNHTLTPRTASIKSCDSDSTLSSRTLHNVSELKMRIKRKSGNDKSEVKHEIINSVDNAQSDSNTKHKKGSKGNRCKQETTSKKTDPYDFAGKNDDVIMPIKRRKIDTHKISTKDCGVNTVSIATMTQPDMLGPVEPGSSITLNGIVWLETTTGILVVNVSWRGRTYVGSLMDATKHDFAPLCLRSYNSPFRPINRYRGRGKRRKLRIAYWNGQKSGSNASRSPRHTALGHNGSELDRKTSQSAEFPIACVHQTCSKRFVDVTALRYHLNQTHSRKAHPIKHSPGSLTKRRRRSSAVPLDETEPCHPPLVDTKPVVNSDSLVSVELFKTPSISQPSVVTSAVNSDLIPTVSFPSIPVDLTPQTTDSKLANAYTSSTNSGAVMPALPVIPTGPKPPGHSRHQVPAYLIDGVSPISSASSSAHESPVDKQNKLRRHNSLTMLKNHSSPRLPDIKTNGMCPRLGYPEQQSPAYSDISDSNDCPAPVLEKEDDIKRPDVPITRSPSVPLTPPCLSQPPSLLPAMAKEEEKSPRRREGTPRSEDFQPSTPKLTSSASSSGFSLHPLPAHAHQPPMFGPPFSHHIPSHLLNHHSLLPPSHHSPVGYSSPKNSKLNGSIYSDPRCGLSSHVQDLSISNQSSPKIYGGHPAGMKSGPSSRQGLPNLPNYSSPNRIRPPINLASPASFHLSPHIMPSKTLPEQISNLPVNDHIAGVGSYHFPQIFPHQ